MAKAHIDIHGNPSEAENGGRAFKEPDDTHVEEKGSLGESPKRNSTLELSIEKLTLTLRLQWIIEPFRMLLSLPGELLKMLLSLRKKPRDGDGD